MMMKRIVLQPVYTLLLSTYFEHPKPMFFPESEKPSFKPIQKTGKIVVLCNKYTCCRNSLFRRTSYKCEVIYHVTFSERDGVPLKSFREQNMKAARSYFQSYKLILKALLMSRI
jgi:hypothetical protein